MQRFTFDKVVSNTPDGLIKQLERRPYVDPTKVLKEQLTAWTSNDRKARRLTMKNFISGDEITGKDLLLSQSTYIKPNGECACLEDIKLPLPTENDKEIGKPISQNDFFDCSELIQPIHPLQYKLADKKYLTLLIDGKEEEFWVVAIPAAKFVDSKNDDIELVDWVTVHKPGKIWYSANIFDVGCRKLFNAMHNVLSKKCQNDHNTGFLHSKVGKMQFLGFVSATMNGNIVESFHIDSFLLFETVPSDEKIHKSILHDHFKASHC
jgi:hypothetical protein